MMDASFLGSVLTAHLWQSVGLAALLAGVLVIGRRLSGELRHGMAWAAFAAAVMLPVMAFIPGDGLLERVLKVTHAPIVILPAEEAPGLVAIDESMIEAAAADESGLKALRTSDLAAWASEADSEGASAHEAAFTPDGLGREANPSPSYLAQAMAGLGTALAGAGSWATGKSALQAYGVIWLLVSLLLLARVARDLVAVERLVGRAQPARLSARFKRRFAGIPIAVSDEISGPMAAGLMRPSILLPETMAQEIETPEVTMFLEHERAHIERFDMLAALSQRVLLAVLWWSPALHWISRRIDEEREAACDEAAVARTGDARGFARSLAKQAEAHLCSPAPRLAVGALGPKSSIGRRLRRLVDFARKGAPGDNLRGRVALAAIILAAFGAGTLTPTLAVAQDRASSPEANEVPPLAVSPVSPAPPAPPAPAAPGAPPAPPAPPANVYALDARDEAEFAALEAELASLGAEIGAMVSTEVIDQLPQIMQQVSVALSHAGLGDHLDQAELQREIAEAQREVRQELGENLREEIRQSLEEAREEIQQAREEAHDNRQEREDAMRAARDAMREARDEIARARDRGDFNFHWNWNGDGDLDGALNPIKFKPGKGGGSDADRALYRAIRDGDTDAARAAIKAGANADRGFPGDGTQLMFAVREGDVDMVRLLLDNGAKPNHTSPGDGSPLIYAARDGDTSIARLLLERGANPNLGSPGDGTPLIMAVQEGDISMVRALLDHGANPNVGAPGDGTPLIAAALEGHSGMVRLLLERGANPNASMPGDGNPLIAAARGGEMEILRLLVDNRANVNAYVPGDETPLIAAAEEGDLDAVKFLVERGAKIDASYRVPTKCQTGKSMDTRSALSMAECRGHDDVAAYLRSKGAK